MDRITDVDVLVSGGGVAGLTAAAAFGAAGFRVLCTDPAAPPPNREAEDADLRSTAFLQPSRRVLERAGVWDRLAAHATDLQVMQITDLAGTADTSRAFDAAELGSLPFGWNLPNWLLRRELAAHLEGLDHVDFRPGVSTGHMLGRAREARVSLSDGTRLRARLVIAADGRGSPLRQAAGIGVRTFRYGQKALAFAVSHPVPHENRSTEVHEAGGPFTLVPLPDQDGRPASAVVWMDRGAEVLRRAALDVAQFEEEMSARSGHVLGPLTLLTRRSVWPIISQLADRLTAERLALIAEAAHVVPPIGAQGLNMSLADIACLLDLAEAHRDDLGNATMLAAYERKRRPDIATRVLGVDALNRASMSGSEPMQALRAKATALLHDVPALRRGLMQMGMANGGRGPTPG